MRTTLPITFDIRRSRIRIHKRTLEQLSFPEQIIFLVNPDERVLVIAPSADINRAYRLHFDPAESNFEIASTALLAGIYRVCPAWHGDQNYRVDGEYRSRENMILFPLDTAVPVKNMERAQYG